MDDINLNVKTPEPHELDGDMEQMMDEIETKNEKPFGFGMFININKLPD